MQGLSGKSKWAIGLESELQNGAREVHKVLHLMPLDGPDGIAAALPDSGDRMKRKVQERVPAAVGAQLKCQVQRMWRFGLRRYVSDVPSDAQARAMARSGVGADAEVKLAGSAVMAPADRRRAELRHVSSHLVESCSTLLTRIGPAIVFGQAADQALASLSGGGAFRKRHLRKRVRTHGRARALRSRAPLRAAADVTDSPWAGSCGGRWQGHLLSLPFLTDSDGPRREVRAEGGSAGERYSFARGSHAEVATVASSFEQQPASHSFWPSSTLTANRTGGYLLTCPILLYLPIHPPGVQTHPPVLIPPS